MRKALTAFLLLGVAACSGGEQESSSRSEDLKTFNVEEGGSSNATAVDSAAPAAPPPPVASGTPQPPGIAPTAAPGVAFNYQFEFRLPALKISQVQEQHAQACEKLGTDKCRITGLHYVLREEDEVEAQLAFKLAPELARKFGTDGAEMVRQASGILTATSITGEDVGSRIEEGTRAQSTVEGELRRVEEQLARRGLGQYERTELQAQAQALRERLRSEAEQQRGRRAQLATTPVVFTYHAGDTLGAIPRALERAGENFLSGVSMLLILIISLLPWLAAALGAFVIWRLVRRPLQRLLHVTEPRPAVEEAALPPTPQD
jgi:hypothetical protein